MHTKPYYTYQAASWLLSWEWSLSMQWFIMFTMKMLLGVCHPSEQTLHWNFPIPFWSFPAIQHVGGPHILLVLQPLNSSHPTSPTTWGITPCHVYYIYIYNSLKRKLENHQNPIKSPWNPIKSPSKISKIPSLHHLFPPIGLRLCSSAAPAAPPAALPSNSPRCARRRATRWARRCRCRRSGRCGRRRRRWRRRRSPGAFRGDLWRFNHCKRWCYKS